MTTTSYPSATRDDEAAEALSWILQRISFNNRIDEETGPKQGRSRETAAMEWALAELGEMFPEELDEAHRLVEERHRRFVRNAQRKRLPIAAGDQKEPNE